MENELKEKINDSNSELYQIKKEYEKLEKQYKEKLIHNKKLQKEKGNFESVVQSKNETISKLKSQLIEAQRYIEEKEKENFDLKSEKKKNLKEIDFLLRKNEEYEEKDKSDKNNCHYEQQINESNSTIQRMGDMIKELESQVEELQKEIEKQNKKMRSKVNYETQLAKKDKEIKTYLSQMKLLTDEKNKLFEDNTKMYNDIDKLQNHIFSLTDKNKDLESKLLSQSSQRLLRNNSYKKYSSTVEENKSNDELSDI